MKKFAKNGKQRNQNTKYERASLISRLYCLYVFPFLYRNYKQNFNLDAIEPNAKRHGCELLAGQLRKNWNSELELNRAGKTASVIRALFRTFGWTYAWMNGCNFVVYGIFRMVMPLILGRIILYSNLFFQEDVVSYSMINNATLSRNSSSPSTENLLDKWLQLTNRQNVAFYSGMLAILVLVNILMSQPYFMVKFRLGMRIRIALTRLVYEKALKVTNQTVQRNTQGKIINLISNDANRFDMGLIYIEFIYMSLLETSVAMFFLHQYIGRSSLGSLGIVLLYIPFQTIMANVLSRFRSKSIILTDNRLRLMSEILPAMRVIKMYVWEKPFSALVHLARRLEISKIRQSMFLRSINLALFFVSSKVMSFVCIILFILDGGLLDAEVVFVSLALINQIQDIMTYQFPSGIACGVETYISVKRIEKFLLEDEISMNQIAEDESLLNQFSQEAKISLKNVTVNSDLDDTSILKDISFDVIPGKLTTIIGPVGSGKSSILLTILNELKLSNPKRKVTVNGRMIYASQEAWIFNGTVRENILFGREFDAIRYREVVKVAALAADMKQFPEGDQTKVDDRGTSLSGGQRARISLARALYTDADCYLLDDPLSAVDASVAKHIFEKCIKEYLKNKCVILVTHQLQFIKQADQIVVLKDGACLACGSYLELLNKGIDLFKYTTIATNDPDPNEQSPQESPSVSQSRFNRKQSIMSNWRRNSRAISYIESISDIESIYEQSSILDYGSLSGGQVAGQSSGQQTLEPSGGTSEVESNQKKSVLKIYWTYIQAGGGLLLFVTFLVSNVTAQILFTGTDYWLSAWTDYQEKSAIQDNDPDYQFDRNPIIASEMNVNIAIYSSIVFILFCFAIIRTVSYFVICMRASVNLHNRIFSSLIQAPIMFFDKTPIGIIMNRVSRDLGIIDDILPPTGFEALEILGNSVGIFILCTALNYFIVFPFVILLVLIYMANKFYVDTARKLKRLEATARSPLFNQMASTLNGLTTIRSYKSEKMFVQKFSETQDRHTATLFTYLSANRLYAIFLELICVAYIYSLIVALNIQLEDYTGSVIGLTISQSLLLCNQFNWGLRQYTEVETYMTSVERIAEFGQLEKESLEECVQEPPESWPQNGDLVYEDVSLAYDGEGDDPPRLVLLDLTFNIRGGEKIGIVGRTGAGKSSLIVTLFRLNETTGAIRIDGIDTSTVSLSRLRRSLSIIPQEPILFSGNIRRNLDPFNEKTDEQLWDAIEKVQLKTKIASLPAKLDSPVSECGSDFSVGQKQLICLARAILRSNKILILDEATANVDPRTDSCIQQAIRTEFADCTVLTIAHRINTIIDYDRVMVLDAGSLAQFDTPHNLIEQRDGIFHELFDNLNQEIKGELRRIAQRAHVERQLN